MKPSDQHRSSSLIVSVWCSHAASASGEGSPIRMSLGMLWGCTTVILHEPNISNGSTVFTHMNHTMKQPPKSQTNHHCEANVTNYPIWSIEVIKMSHKPMIQSEALRNSYGSNIKDWDEASLTNHWWICHRCRSPLSHRFEGVLCGATTTSSPGLSRAPATRWSS